MTLGRCTIYRHVIEGEGPLCDCGSLITQSESAVRVVAVRETLLLEVLKATSEEFRQWLAAQETVAT